ncbi:MAG: response regulator transcription factor [Peptostreptococcaceae bacterium]|nr:response regulator transcription factor [Peptostreptococcaceae bacterium]
MNDRILIVEDEYEVGEMISEHLKKEGYVVEIASDGEAGLQKFHKVSFDLIILDLMLPKKNGLDVLKSIRGISTIPILIVSAKDSDVEKSLGLELGADDYLAKPFSMIEFSSRVRAILRRAGIAKQPCEDEIISCREITLNTMDFTVQKRGKAIRLTAKEFDILHLFFKNPKRTFTKSQIYNEIWQDTYYGDENVINVHIRRLREKIEDDPSHPKYIQTVWGIGYRLGE